jgi:hypothetical protein
VKNIKRTTKGDITIVTIEQCHNVFQTQIIGGEYDGDTLVTFALGAAIINHDYYVRRAR